MDSEFGFSNMAGGLAHQVICGASGSLSPPSLWVDSSQSASAPPTANVNIVQTQKPYFPTAETNILSSTSTFHGDQEQSHHQQYASAARSSRSGSGDLKLQTTEENILEEQENEDEANLDLQNLNIQFKEENRVTISDEEKAIQEGVCEICCMENIEMLQHERIAPQLESEVVIEQSDDSSIRFAHKTENPLQIPSNEVTYSSGTTSSCSLSCHNSLQQNEQGDSGISSSLQIDGGAPCGNDSASLSSPPVSPNCASSEGELIYKEPKYALFALFYV